VAGATGIKLFYHVKHLGEVRQFQNPLFTAPVRFRCRTFYLH